MGFNSISLCLPSETHFISLIRVIFKPYFVVAYVNYFYKQSSFYCCLLRSTSTHLVFNTVNYAVCNKWLVETLL